MRLVLVVLVAGTILRLTFLDADPSYDLWPGYLADEGRWTEQARELVLFGSPHFDTWYSRVHVAMAPLFQVLAAVSFVLFGVSFTSARLVSALMGTGLLVSAFVLLRREFSAEGLLLTTVVLGLQPDLLFLSRVAIPEMASMFFQFLAFWVLVGTKRTWRTAVIGGLIAAVALGFKGTALPIVPIFALCVWMVHEIDDPSSRLARLAGFIGGVLAPALAIFGLAIVTGLGSVLDFADLKVSVAGFLRPGSAYGAAAFLFERDYASVLNVALLPLWTIAGLLMASGGLPKSNSTAIYVGSSIWVVASLLLSASLDYYPLYYSFHLLVPVAINLGAGLTLLQSQIPGAVGKQLAWGNGLVGRLAIVCLTMPPAVILSRLSVAAADTLGFQIVRFTHRVALMVLIQALLLGVVSRWRRGSFTAVTVFLPLVAVPLWALGVRTGLFEGLFWASGGMKPLATWASVVVIASASTLFLFVRYGQVVSMWKWAFGYVAAFSFIWLFQVLPPIVFPTYTIAEASAAIGAEFQGSGVIGTESASSIFLGNELFYTEKTRGDGPLPEIVVVAFDRFPPVDLENEYILIGSYKLNFGRRVDLRPEQSILEVYRRIVD